MLHCYLWYLVSLKNFIIFLFFVASLEAKNLTFQCQNLISAEDIHNLNINYKNKQLLFKENIYLFNSYTENIIFAQRRSILLNSFLEFNEKSNMLTEVNSWLYKVTKDDYICKKIDSSKGYK